MGAALVTKARAQVDIGDFAGAAATVASVPTTFQYNFDYSQTSATHGLPILPIVGIRAEL